MIFEDYINYGFTRDEILELADRPWLIIPKERCQELYSRFKDDIWDWAYQHSLIERKSIEGKIKPFANVLDYLAHQHAASDVQDHFSFIEWLCYWAVKDIAIMLTPDSD